MAPPPATPTPHRFLVPKRSQPKNETPRALQTGGQQFQTTPRFSLHSTTRASAPSHASSSTPAAPGATYRQRNADLINDIVDSSPPFAPETGQDHYESVESDVVQESSPIRATNHESDDDDDDALLDTRSFKRRRISVSSDPGFEESSSQPHGSQDLLMRDDDDDDEDDDDDDFGLVIESSSLPEEPPHSDDLNVGPFLPRSTSAAQPQQPTFQKAPRFKPVEVPEGSGHEPLPDAFSPHRRGAKYIPGGLAAELRDWLVDVEAGTGAKPKRDGDEWLARVLVEEVRAAPGFMTLVTGRQVRDEHDDDEEGEVEVGTDAVRIVLAGPGRISGLARRNEVHPGAVIGIAKPAWEVGLQDLGRWGVACDWVVLR